MALTIIIEGQANLGVTTGAPATITIGVGVPGAAATVNVGSTTTGNPGTNASVINSGNSTNAVFDFTIPRGNVGATGAKGDKGDTGSAGSAATVNVGTTTTSEPGADATVFNSGTNSDAILDFTIPRGEQGPRGFQGSQGEPGQPGQKGDKGDTGNAATIAIFGTNTVPPDYPANVENFGTPQAASFYFSIPQGVKGDQGEQGPRGFTGETGAGVVPGGSAGQVLAKIDGTSYNTHWVDVSSGGGTWGSITGTLSNQTDLYSALNGKLSLSGGTMSGTIFLPSLRNLLNTNLTVTAYNDTGAGTNFVHTFNAYDGTFALATNGGGLKFPDATVQTTAGLPLTGGTVTGDVTFASNSILTLTGDVSTIQLSSGDGFINILNNSGQGIRIQSDLIQFADGSEQTTAGLPLTGGTMSSASINGSVDASNWSFGYNGLYGYNDASSALFNFDAGSIYATTNNGYNTFTLDPSGVSGTVGDDPAQSWSFGVSGLTFSDSTVQTTAFTGNYLPLTGGTMANGANVELYKTISDADPLATSHLIVRAEGYVDGGSNYRNKFTDINANEITIQGDGDNFFQSVINSEIGFKHTGIDGGIITVNGDFGFKHTGNEGGIIIVNGDVGITFPDSSVQTTAGLPLNGGRVINGDYIYDFSDGGFAVVKPGITNLTLSDEGIILQGVGSKLQFPDTTIQTTAGIPEAPIDGNAYVRKNGAWVNINDL